ncbi:hypothetical protein Tco_0846989 [Tanacetum coccineum]
MYVDGESAAEILANTATGNNWRRRALRFSLDEFCGRKITIPVQRNNRKTWSQEVVSSPVNSSQNAKDPDGRGSNHLKKQQVGFVGMRAYKLRDLTESNSRALGMSATSRDVMFTQCKQTYLCGLRSLPNCNVF